MTYIQDKLDELIETYRKETGFTEYDARMIAERLVVDYHNHIVEKIHEYADSQDDESIAMGIRGTVSLVNDLQDNPASQDNPKE
jgi:hypothetical protein